MSKERFLKLVIFCIANCGYKLEDLHVVKTSEDMLSLHSGDKGLASLIENNKTKAALKFVEFNMLLNQLKNP